MTESLTTSRSLSAHLNAGRLASQCARLQGIRLSVTDLVARGASLSDAHSTGHLANMTYGIGTAQRGWLTPDDVMNTWPLGRLTAFLAKGQGRR